MAPQPHLQSWRISASKLSTMQSADHQFLLPVASLLILLPPCLFLRGAPVVVILPLHPVNRLEELVPSLLVPEPELLLCGVAKLVVACSPPQIVHCL